MRGLPNGRAQRRGRRAVICRTTRFDLMVSAPRARADERFTAATSARAVAPSNAVCIDTSFGLTFTVPNLYLSDPRADGVAGLVPGRCGLVSRHGVLPSRAEPRLPWEQYRDGARPAEMPVGYRRNVSAASRTEAPLDLTQARFADQTFSEKPSNRRQAVASPNKRGVWPPAQHRCVSLLKRADSPPLSRTVFCWPSPANAKDRFRPARYW